MASDAGRGGGGVCAPAVACASGCPHVLQAQLWASQQHCCHVLCHSLSHRKCVFNGDVGVPCRSLRILSVADGKALTPTAGYTAASTAGSDAGSPTLRCKSLLGCKQSPTGLGVSQSTKVCECVCGAVLLAVLLGPAHTNYSLLQSLPASSSAARLWELDSTSWLPV